MLCRLVLFVAVLSLPLQGYNQTVDQRVEELIMQEDWFTLDEEYPQLKDCIQSPLLESLGRDDA